MKITTNKVIDLFGVNRLGGRLLGDAELHFHVVQSNDNKLFPIRDDSVSVNYKNKIFENFILSYNNKDVVEGCDDQAPVALDDVPMVVDYSHSLSSNNFSDRNSTATTDFFHEFYLSQAIQGTSQSYGKEDDEGMASVSPWADQALVIWGSTIILGGGVYLSFNGKSDNQVTQKDTVNKNDIELEPLSIEQVKTISPSNLESNNIQKPYDANQNDSNQPGLNQPRLNQPGLSQPDILVDGRITLGPVVEGNGLSVEVFSNDNQLIAVSEIDESGRYYVAVPQGYSVIKSRIVDSDNKPDYIDELTGEPKNLTGKLFAVTTISASGEAEKLNINPISTMASLLMGDNATGMGELLKSEQIDKINNQVAKVLLDKDVDLASYDVLPVIDKYGNRIEGNEGGFILAILSALEELKNWSTDQVVREISEGFIFKNGELALSDYAIRLLQEGASYFSERHNNDSLSAQLNAHVGSIIVKQKSSEKDIIQGNNEFLVEILEDETYSFDNFILADFIFNDDYVVTQAISPTQLPESGALTFNGDLLSINNNIIKDDIANISFTPSLNENGKSYANFVFLVTNNFTSTVEKKIIFDVKPINDIAIITGKDKGMVVEDTLVVDDYLITSGQLTIEDPDQGEAFFIEESLLGEYGQLTISTKGLWTYSVDNSLPIIQMLDDEEFVVDTFTVRSLDETTHEVSILVRGISGLAYVKVKSTPGDLILFKDIEGAFLDAAIADSNGDAFGQINEKLVDKFSSGIVLGDSPVAVISDEAAVLKAIAVPGTLIAFNDRDGNYLGSSLANPEGVARLQVDGSVASILPVIKVVNEEAPIESYSVVDERGTFVKGAALPGSAVVFKDDTQQILGSAIADSQGNVQLSIDDFIFGDISIDTITQEPIILSSANDMIESIAKPGTLVVFSDRDGQFIGSSIANDEGKAYIEITDPAVASRCLASTISPSNPEPLASIDNAGKIIKGVALPGSVVVFKDDNDNILGNAVADANGHVWLSLKTPLQGGIVVESVNKESPLINTVGGAPGQLEAIALPGSVLAFHDTGGQYLGAAMADNQGIARSSAIEPQSVSGAVVKTINETNPVASFDNENNVIKGVALPGQVVALIDSNDQIIGHAVAESNGQVWFPSDKEPNGPIKAVPVNNDAPLVYADITNNQLIGIAPPETLIVFNDPQGQYVGAGFANHRGEYRLNIDDMVADDYSVKSVKDHQAVVDTFDTGRIIEGAALPGTLIVFNDDSGNALGRAIADSHGRISLPLETPFAGDINPLIVTNTSPLLSIDRENNMLKSIAPPETLIAFHSSDGHYLGLSPANHGGVASLLVEGLDSMESAHVVAINDDNAIASLNDSGTAIVGAAMPRGKVAFKSEEGQVIGIATADDQGEISLPLDRPIKGQITTVPVTDTNPILFVDERSSQLVAAGAPDSVVAFHDKVGNYLGASVTNSDGVGYLTIDDLEQVQSPNVSLVDNSNPIAMIDDAGLEIEGVAIPNSVIGFKTERGDFLGSTLSKANGELSCTLDEPYLGRISAVPMSENTPFVFVDKDKNTVDVVAEANAVIAFRDGKGQFLGSTLTNSEGLGSLLVEDAKTLENPSASFVDDANVLVTIDDSGKAIKGVAKPGSIVAFKNDQGHIIGSVKATDSGSINLTLPSAVEGDITTVIASAHSPLIAIDNDNQQLKTIATPSSRLAIIDQDKYLGSVLTDTEGIALLPFNANQIVDSPIAILVDTKNPICRVDNSGKVIKGIAEPGTILAFKDGNGNILGGAKANNDGEVFKVLETPILGQLTTISVTKNQPIALKDHANQRLEAIALPGSLVTFSDSVGNILGKSQANNEGKATLAVSDFETLSYPLADIISEAPESSDKTITLIEDAVYVFQSDDFSFTDLDKTDYLKSIVITASPDTGYLRYDREEVRVGREIYINDIDQLTFMPERDANGNGYDQLSFRVKDNLDTLSLQPNTLTFDVTPIHNDPPTAKDNTFVVSEDGSHLFNVDDFGFSDVDEGDELHSVTIQSLPARGELQLSNLPVDIGQEISALDIPNLKFLPIKDSYGNNYADVRFQVKDTGGFTSIKENLFTFSVTSGLDPPEGNDFVVNIEEDQTHTFHVNDFGFSDADAGDTLHAVIIKKVPNEGVLRLSTEDVKENQVILSENIGHLNYSPAMNASGMDYAGISFRVQDNTQLMSQMDNTITINVASVDNDAPLSRDFIVNVLEDSRYTFSVNDFYFEDFDEGDKLKAVAIKSLPSKGMLKLSDELMTLNQVISLGDIKNIHFIPEENQFGSEYSQFNFTLIDNKDVQSLSQYTVTMDVQPTNDLPKSENIIRTLLEDTAYSFLTGDFKFDDPDAGDMLRSVKILKLPTLGDLSIDGQAVSQGQVINSDSLNKLVYMPAKDASGNDFSTINFSVLDDFGGESIEENVITFHVEAVDDDAPVGQDSIQSLLEDNHYRLQKNDFGFSDVDGDTLHSIIITSLPSRGSLTLDGKALDQGQVIMAYDFESLLFSPPMNANGDNYAVLGFKVIDSTGLSSDHENTLTFNVTPVSDAPSAQNKTFSMLEDSSHHFIVNDFGFNDIDKNDSLESVTITSLPLKGQLTLFEEAITIDQTIGFSDISQLKFTPDNDEYGTNYATVSFYVKDSFGIRSTLENTLVFDIVSRRDAPTSLDHRETIIEDHRYQFKSSDFIFNDKDKGDTFDSIIISALPTQGQLELFGNMVNINDHISVNDIAGLRFTPGADDNGKDYSTFFFNVMDSSGLASKTANTFIFDVTSVNDAPVLNNSSTPIIARSSQETPPLSGHTEESIQVNTIVQRSLGLNSYHDAEGGMSGIAVFFAQPGTYYSIDGGNTWLDLSNTSSTEAILLDGNALLHATQAVPLGNVIGFRAWDGSSGYSGETGVNLTIVGGESAFSQQVDYIQTDFVVNNVSEDDVVYYLRQLFDGTNNIFAQGSNHSGIIENEDVNDDGIDDFIINLSPEPTLVWYGHIPTNEPSSEFVSWQQLDVAADKSGMRVPRLYDWEQDGDVDIVLANKGEVLLYKNEGTFNQAGIPEFSDPISLQYDHKNIISEETENTAIVLTDVTGDDALDLMVVDIVDNQRIIHLYINRTQSNKEPVYLDRMTIKDLNGDDFILPNSRFDLSDVNGDGLKDLVVGVRAGKVKLFVNEGSSSMPQFNTEPYSILETGGYNLYPRLIDVNKNGTVDYVRPINWGPINYTLDPDWSLALSNNEQFSIKDADQITVTDNTIKEQTNGIIADFSDINNDGYLDMIAGGHGESNGLYIGLGVPDKSAFKQNLTFISDVFSASDILQANNGVTFLDANSDGFSDIIIGKDNTVSYYKGKANGQFEDMPFDTVQTAFIAEDTSVYLTVHDLNKDGSKEIIAVSAYIDQPIKIYRINSDHRFEDVSAQFPFLRDLMINNNHEYRGLSDIAVGDFNGDKHADFYVSGDQLGHQVYLQNSDGSYAAPVQLRTLLFDRRKESFPQYNEENDALANHSVTFASLDAYGSKDDLVVAFLNEEGELTRNKTTEDGGSVGESYAGFVFDTEAMHLKFMIGDETRPPGTGNQLTLEDNGINLSLMELVELRGKIYYMLDENSDAAINELDLLASDSLIDMFGTNGRLSFGGDELRLLTQDDFVDTKILNNLEGTDIGHLGVWYDEAIKNEPAYDILTRLPVDEDLYEGIVIFQLIGG